jgi:hypothetical protein
MVKKKAWNYEETVDGVEEILAAIEGGDLELTICCRSRSIESVRNFFGNTAGTGRIITRKFGQNR